MARILKTAYTFDDVIIVPNNQKFYQIKFLKTKLQKK